MTAIVMIPPLPSSCRVGEYRTATSIDPVELAALTAVAGLVLNLDETLQRK